MGFMFRLKPPYCTFAMSALNTLTTPAKHFVLTCKQCNRIFAWSIVLSSKGVELDKITKNNNEACPHCPKFSMYKPDDNTFV